MAYQRNYGAELTKIDQTIDPAKNSTDDYHADLARLARGVAAAFSDAGIPITRRFSKILDLACEVLKMDVGQIAMWNDSVMTPLFLSSGQNKNDAQPLSYDLIERLSAAPHVVLQDHDCEASQRYIAVAVRFDGRLHGVLELRSTKEIDQAFTDLEQALVQMIAAYAAGPLVLLGTTG